MPANVLTEVYDFMQGNIWSISKSSSKFTCRCCMYINNRINTNSHGCYGKYSNYNCKKYNKHFAFRFSKIKKIHFHINAIVFI